MTDQTVMSAINTTDKFATAIEGDNKPDFLLRNKLPDHCPRDVNKLPPDEEQDLLAESNTYRYTANGLFASKKFEAAITEYDTAISVCPDYLDYELAVLKSNIAACHLQLNQWKEAVENATAALVGLARVEEGASEDQNDARSEAKPHGEVSGTADNAETQAETVSSGAVESAPVCLESLQAQQSGTQREADILRIKAKSLMRRARARSEMGGWSNLSGAEEDYKILASMSNLSSSDRKIVQSQLRILPPKTKAAQEKEMGEMWGKLKDLGNGILKPFGLSTDNFQMIKDERSGGYSMNFMSGNK